MWGSWMSGLWAMSAMVRATLRTLSRERPVRRPLSRLSFRSVLEGESSLQKISRSLGVISLLVLWVWNLVNWWVRVSWILFFSFSVVKGFWSGWRSV